jgi:hypothetical protein
MQGNKDLWILHVGDYTTEFLINVVHLFGNKEVGRKKNKRKERRQEQNGTWREKKEK